MSRRLRLVPGLGLLVALGACAGSATAPPISYYLLLPEHLTTAPRVDSEGPSLRIGRVNISPHVRGITLIRQDGKVDTAVYHQWAAPPQDMVTRWVRDALLATGRFAFVAGPRSTARSDLVLDLDLLRLDVEAPDEGPVTGVVVIEGLLTREDDRTPLLTRRWQASAGSDAEGIEAVISALRDALERVVPLLAEEVAERLPVP